MEQKILKFIAKIKTESKSIEYMKLTSKEKHISLEHEIRENAIYLAETSKD
jgi:hypothetical protein